MFSFLFLLLPLLYYSDGDPSSDAIQTSESAMIMTRVRSLTCHSTVNLSRFVGRMVVYHDWNQVYPGNLSVVNLPSIEAFNTQYTVELHKFDNNSNIYSMISVYNASNGLEHVFNYALDCAVLQRKWINLVDDDIYRSQFDHVITYVGTKSVKFSCLQYLHLTNLLEIQIGWITTAGDMIFTYKEKEILLNLTDVYNGSMLCCLYYTTSDFKNGKHIKRFVKDKTLLIYQKETPPHSKGQPTGTSTVSYECCKNEGNRNNTTSPTTTQFIADTSSATEKNSNTTNKTGITSGTTNETSKYSSITNEADQKINNTNTTDKTAGNKNVTSKYSGTTNETDQKTNNTNTTDKTTGATNRTDSSNHDADTDYVIIIISSISAILVLLLIGFCAIRRHYMKKTNRPKRAQLPLPQIPGARLRPADEPDINTPFYLNLLFRRECELEIQAREEPQYEEVMYQ